MFGKKKINPKIKLIEDIHELENLLGKELSGNWINEQDESVLVCKLRYLKEEYNEKENIKNLE